MRASLLALGLLGLMATGAAAQSVGVASAVNQSALGISPGQAAKTVYLGDQIIHNQKITTNAAGLLQILLADGTSFTVGPNSSLTIDSFVYDPDKGTAKIVADLGTGLFRFIGGKSSKAPDGVTLNTPVGTVGIQGGITNLDFSGATPFHIDMVYGVGVTLKDGTQVIGDLYHSGYSIVIGTDGKVGVQKTPPEWSAAFQTAMTGHGSGGGVSGSKVAGLGGTNKTNNEPPGNQNPPPNGGVPSPDGLFSTWAQIDNSGLAGAKARYDGTYDGTLTSLGTSQASPTTLLTVEDKRFALIYSFSNRTGSMYLASPLLPLTGDPVPAYNSHGRYLPTLSSLASIWIPVAADDLTGSGPATFSATGQGKVLGGLLTVDTAGHGVFLNTNGIGQGVAGSFETGLKVGSTFYDLTGVFGGTYTPPQ